MRTVAPWNRRARSLGLILKQQQRKYKYAAYLKRTNAKAKAMFTRHMPRDSVRKQELQQSKPSEYCLKNRLGEGLQGHKLAIGRGAGSLQKSWHNVWHALRVRREHAMCRRRPPQADATTQSANSKKVHLRCTHSDGNSKTRLGRRRARCKNQNS